MIIFVLRSDCPYAGTASCSLCSPGSYGAKGIQCRISEKNRIKMKYVCVLGAPWMNSECCILVWGNTAFSKSVLWQVNPTARPVFLECMLQHQKVMIADSKQTGRHSDGRLEIFSGPE